VLDTPYDELELAGNGAHEIRSWLAVAGAVDPVRPRTLAYEPVYPWITGMAVAQWETVPDRQQTSATAEAQDSRREESLT
jgi:hypothetical protein